jgi:hypothetical protein
VIRYFPALAAVLALAACGGSSAPAPSAASPAADAHAREVAAVATWLHGAGGQLWDQAHQALDAWTKSPTQANAENFWTIAGVSRKSPPPAGTAAFVAALGDWQMAAQLAGGDPGAPTGSLAQIRRYMNAGDVQIGAATAAMNALQ